MSELKSQGQISPFSDINQQMGNVFMMVHEAFKLMLDDLWLQSPHWEQEPTKEKLEQEKKLEQRSEEAKVEIRRLACEIFKSLTGEEIK